MQNTPFNNNGIMPGQTAKEVFPTPVDSQSKVDNISILGLSKTERLELAINDLHRICSWHNRDGFGRLMGRIA